MNYLTKLEKHNGSYVVSSRVIANELGKRHKNIIRDLDKILEGSDLSSLIIPNTYRVSNQNRTYREYLLTKDGFTLYMFNIQGYIDFKMAYINEFNRMEQELRNKTLPFKPTVPTVVKKSTITKEEIPTLFEELKSAKRMIAFLTKEIEKDTKEIKNLVGRIEDHKSHISWYASILNQIV